MWAINHMERGRIDSSMTKTPSHSDGRLRSVLQSTKSHVFIAFHVRMSSYREMCDDFVQTFFFIHKMVHQAHNGMVFILTWTTISEKLHRSNLSWEMIFNKMQDILPKAYVEFCVDTFPEHFIAYVVWGWMILLKQSMHQANRQSIR